MGQSRRRRLERSPLGMEDAAGGTSSKAGSPLATRTAPTAERTELRVITKVRLLAKPDGSLLEEPVGCEAALSVVEGKGITGTVSADEVIAVTRVSEVLNLSTLWACESRTASFVQQTSWVSGVPPGSYLSLLSVLSPQAAWGEGLENAPEGVLESLSALSALARTDSSRWMLATARPHLRCQLRGERTWTDHHPARHLSHDHGHPVPWPGREEAVRTAPRLS